MPRLDVRANTALPAASRAGPHAHKAAPAVDLTAPASESEGSDTGRGAAYSRLAAFRAKVRAKAMTTPRLQHGAGATPGSQAEAAAPWPERTASPQQNGHKPSALFPGSAADVQHVLGATSAPAGAAEPLVDDSSARGSVDHMDSGSGVPATRAEGAHGAEQQSKAGFSHDGIPPNALTRGIREGNGGPPSVRGHAPQLRIPARGENRAGRANTPPNALVRPRCPELNAYHATPPLQRRLARAVPKQHHAMHAPCCLSTRR